MTATGVVLIASDTDPARGIVTGQHIELRDGEPVRLRPWRLRIATPDELDSWAAAAGLTAESHREALGRQRLGLDRAHHGLPPRGLSPLDQPGANGWTRAHWVAIATSDRSWSQSSAVPAA